MAAQSTEASDNLTGTFRFMMLDLLDNNARAKSERDAARAQTAKLSAATYDLNHDGKLDATEFAAWDKAVRGAVEESPRALKKFDKNGDKKLDDAEWAVARRELLGL